MGEFDAKERIRQLYLEFEQVDQVHHNFILDFENEIYNLLHSNFNSLNLVEDFPDVLKRFATGVINTIYSVLEKDKYYNKYRMNLELDNVKEANDRAVLPDDRIFYDLNCKVREVVISYFKEVFDLSGNGFRLLASSIEYNVKDFIIYFYNEHKIKQLD